MIGPLVPRSGAIFANPDVRAFFSGDLMGGRALTELACASLIGALTVWVQFRIARFYLSPRKSVALALLFAFGTSEWSVASRNLMQHGFTLLLLSGASTFLWRRNSPGRDCGRRACSWGSPSRYVRLTPSPA